MKKYWFSFLFFSNLLFVLINGWKLTFTFTPDLIVLFGAFVALANFLTVSPTFLKLHMERGSESLEGRVKL